MMEVPLWLALGAGAALLIASLDMFDAALNPGKATLYGQGDGRGVYKWINSLGGIGCAWGATDFFSHILGML